MVKVKEMGMAKEMVMVKETVKETVKEMVIIKLVVMTLARVIGTIQTFGSKKSQPFWHLFCLSVPIILTAIVPN